MREITTKRISGLPSDSHDNERNKGELKKKRLTKRVVENELKNKEVKN